MCFLARQFELLIYFAECDLSAINTAGDRGHDAMCFLARQFGFSGPSQRYVWSKMLARGRGALMWQLYFLWPFGHHIW